MALTMTYDPEHLLNGARKIERAIIVTMQQIGEDFITEARNQPQPSVSRRRDKKTGKIIYQGPKEGVYEDQTGNLRSSVGYFIVRNNAIIGGRIEGKSEGIQAAKAVLDDIPSRSGIRLIGVAGMNYASAVESLGYNVITKQSYVAVDQLSVQMKALTKKTGKKTDLLNNANIF